jgi:hypothetical protein
MDAAVYHGRARDRLFRSDAELTRSSRDVTIAKGEDLSQQRFG